MKVTGLMIGVTTLIFGFTTGVLIGLSRSPVVGVALPILFSVVGGTGGFYFAKIDFSSKTGGQMLRLMSVAIVLMCAGTLTGVWLGVENRTSSRSWSIITHVPDFPFPPKDTAEGESVEWLVLDTNLHLMGLMPSERRVMLERIHTESQTMRDGQLETNQLDQEIAWLVQTFDALVPPEGVVEMRQEWLSVQNKLKGIHQAISASVIGVEPNVLAPAFEELLQLAEYLNDDEDDVAYLDGAPNVTVSLGEFQIRLTNLAVELGGGRSTLKLSNDRLDDFLSTDLVADRLNIGTSRGLASTTGVLPPTS